MTVNAIFDGTVKVYDVQNRLDVVITKDLDLEIIDAPEGLEIFTNKDPVLALSNNDRRVTAASLGESKIRFMVGDVVVKDLVIVVMESVGPEASSLGLKFEEPIPK